MSDLEVAETTDEEVGDEPRAPTPRERIVGAWRRWVARTSRLEDARPLSLLRVLVCVAMVIDLLQSARLGLVGDLFKTAAHGGIANSADGWAIFSKLSPDHGGEAAWGLAVVALSLAAFGVLTRPMILIGAFADGQLGHVFLQGDRAIDRLLRTVLLILAFSRCDARYALTGKRRERIPGWSSDTIRLFLFIIYTSAGISKLIQQPGWLATSGMPVLYRVMCDPMSAHVDAHAAMPWWPILRALGWGTIAFELGSFLTMTRYAKWWAIVGVTMHLGIFFTMDLGVFSWGMMALYPVLMGEWIVKVEGKVAASA